MKFSTLKKITIFLSFSFILFSFFLIDKFGFESYVGKFYSIKSELFFKFQNSSKSNKICSLENFQSQRLILPLSDELNLPWLIYRSFGLVIKKSNNNGFDQYDDLKKLFNSMPCGVGGFHFTPSYLFKFKSTDEFQAHIAFLREKFKFEFFDHQMNSSFVAPIFSIDDPCIDGINNFLIKRIGYISCKDFFVNNKINFLWGPNLDGFGYKTPSDSELATLISKYPKNATLFYKHFGLSNSNIDTHRQPRLINFDSNIIDYEINKYRKFIKLTNKVNGIMYGHIAFLEPGRNNYLYLIDNSIEFNHIQKSLNSPLSASDAIDMMYSHDHKYPFPVNIRTDFILFVNLYRNIDFINNFLHSNIYDQEIHARLLEFKRSIGLIGPAR